MLLLLVGKNIPPSPSGKQERIQRAAVRRDERRQKDRSWRWDGDLDHTFTAPLVVIGVV